MAIVDGFLAIPKIEMNPLSRIEAWRLLARCRGAKGDSTGACEALERAVEESTEVGFIWMERKALEDMLTWVGGDAATAKRVRERLDAVVRAAAVGLWMGRGAPTAAGELECGGARGREHEALALVPHEPRLLHPGRGGLCSGGARLLAGLVTRRAGGHGPE